MNRSEFLQRYHHLRQIDYEADYPLRKTGRAAGVLIPLIDHPDGLTVLLVEQQLPFARKYADRFVIMDRGRPVAKGEISELSNELIKQHLTV